ncbi:hypothetical protein ROHU_017255 [Labeo rohita]|uniref:Uncharacterized protein n=1 Tax=Labeo rohita TaxID=84645 RepID=A0A498NH54_LABRO|nr:hypothetical protein ROHU_017255 [Labeo rohita]
MIVHGTNGRRTTRPDAAFERLAGHCYENVDKGLGESLSLALVAAVPRVYHPAGWTESSAVIKWNADHLSTVSHNPAAYLTSVPSAALNSGCVDDKRNTDNKPKFHQRARRPWTQHGLRRCVK